MPHTPLRGLQRSPDFLAVGQGASCSLPKNPAGSWPFGSRGRPIRLRTLLPAVLHLSISALPHNLLPSGAYGQQQMQDRESRMRDKVECYRGNVCQYSGVSADGVEPLATLDSVVLTLRAQSGVSDALSAAKTRSSS